MLRGNLEKAVFELCVDGRLVFSMQSQPLDSHPLILGPVGNARAALQRGMEFQSHGGLQSTLYNPPSSTLSLLKEMNPKR